MVGGKSDITPDSPSSFAREDVVPQKAPSHLESSLRAAGLDVNYTKAKGDYLYYENAQGCTVEVLDLVGGYGASLLGHNNPQLVEVLQRLLQEQRPFNSQGSLRKSAQSLCSSLSSIAERETGQPYSAILGSTGSGAVEAALKHAEFEFQRRFDQKRQELMDLQRRLHLIVREKDLVIPQTVRHIFESTLGVASNLNATQLVECCIEQLNKISKTPPVVLALEGGFHGKSTGALSLTENLNYRTPWSRLGIETSFVPKGDSAALDAIIQKACFPHVELELTGNTLSAKSRSIFNIIAAFVEPIQGEGGVLQINRSFLVALRNHATAKNFPLVFDEIQSGMGRTGTFFASTQSGVVPDYILLSKALGGGLSKVSALLIHSERYLPEFEMLHTSTFAKDDYSSEVASAAIGLVEENNGALMKRCFQQGQILKERLSRIQADYPDVVADIRGRGLLLAIEIFPCGDNSSLFLRWASEQGLLGYAIAGYLLREHSIRIAPTLSNPNTLRIQPSAYISSNDIERFCRAIEQVARLLKEHNSGTLLGHLAGLAASRTNSLLVKAAPKPLTPRTESRQVAFIAHLLEPQDARALDLSLSHYSPEQCTGLLQRFGPLLRPVVLHRDHIQNQTGSRVGLSVIGIPFTSAQIMEAFRNGEGDKIRSSVFEAVEVARKEGAEVFGFGGYTSIVTKSCLDIVEDKALVTSGNSVTAAAAIHATMARANALGLTNRRLAVVGAAGNLGCVIAELMAPDAEGMLLVGRPGAERRLHRRVRQIINALGAQCPPIEISTDLSALKSCGIIMTATNAPSPIIFPHHLSNLPTVICDIAAPGDVAHSVLVEKPNTEVLKGGLISLPSNQELAIPGMEYPPGYIYGCLAETILLGLDRAAKSESVGLLTPEGVRSSQKMVERHGFGFKPWAKLTPNSAFTSTNDA